MTTQPHNPFQTLHTRWLFSRMAVVILGLFVVFRVVGGASSTQVAFTVTICGVFALCPLWLYWECRRSGIDIGRLVGRDKTGYDWRYILLGRDKTGFDWGYLLLGRDKKTGYNWAPVILGLLFVTILFGLGSLYVTGYGLSRIAPGMMEWYLGRPLDWQSVDFSAFLVVSLALYVVLQFVVLVILEEVIFRGILVNRLGVKWGIRTGIIVSALLYGVWRGVLPGGLGVIWATVFGLVAAVLYLRTEKLIVPGGFNAVSRVNFVGAWELYPYDLQDIEAMALPGLGMMAVALPVLVWYLRRHWPERGAGIPYMAEDRVAEDRAIDDRAADRRHTGSEVR